MLLTPRDMTHTRDMTHIQETTTDATGARTVTDSTRSSTPTLTKNKHTITNKKKHTITNKNQAHHH